MASYLMVKISILTCLLCGIQTWAGIIGCATSLISPHQSSFLSGCTDTVEASYYRELCITPLWNSLVINVQDGSHRMCQFVAQFYIVPYDKTKTGLFKWMVNSHVSFFFFKIV